MRMFALICGLVLALTLTGAQAQPPARAAGVPVNPNLEKDVYVVLYKQRLKISEVAITRQRAVIAYSAARLERMRRLIQSGAASREEYDEAVARAAVDVATLEEYTLKVAESEALLDLCRARRENGLDMPIFPHQSDNNPIFNR